MDSRSAGNLLKEKFPNAVTGTEEFRGETTVVIDSKQLREIATFLKQNSELAYDMLLDLAGVDFPEEKQRFTISYLFNSTRFNNKLRIKTKTAEEAPVDSVSDIWKAANWMERETSEMFGITFSNHPNPKHILLTDDFEGYPLRKDYDVKGPDFGQPLRICLDEEKEIY